MQFHLITGLVLNRHDLHIEVLRLDQLEGA